MRVEDEFTLDSFFSFLCIAALCTTFSTLNKQQRRLLSLRFRQDMRRRDVSFILSSSRTGAIWAPIHAFVTKFLLSGSESRLNVLCHGEIYSMYTFIFIRSRYGTD